MSWNVTFSRSAQKQLPQLPKKVLDVLVRLLAELEVSGPVRVTGLTTPSSQMAGITAISKKASRVTLLYGEKVKEQ